MQILSPERCAEASTEPRGTPPSRGSTRFARTDGPGLAFSRRTGRLAAAGLAVLSAACGRTSTNTAADTSTQEPSGPIVRSAPAALQSLSGVVRAALPSVVSISSTRVVKAPAPRLPFEDPFFGRFFGEPFRSPRESRQHGLGSGVVIKPGVVVTNNHVVEGADEIRVTAADKREFKAKLVGADTKTDLAVLRLEGNVDGLRPLPFGDSRGLELGDLVLAIGYPFAVGETVTMGIVSGLGRTDLGIEQYEDFIQTDAAINPGNSGGALIDTQGRLVGINTAILSQSGGHIGIGFAIPTQMASPIVEVLLKTGKVVRGYLGVAIQDLTPELAAALKLPNLDGVLVSGVEPNTPAARAGIERGDVILKVEGNPMKSSGQLRNTVAATPINQTITLDVWRGGKSLRIKAKVSELPASHPAASVVPPGGGEPPAASVSGLTLEPLSEAAKQKYDLPRELNAGLVVAEVAPGSPGAVAGLRPGDVVIEINRQPVGTPGQFKQQWEKSRDVVLLLVQRGSATIFLAVRK